MLKWKLKNTLCCIVEIHVTVNNIEILSVAQDILSMRIYIADSNKVYVGLCVNCAIFLCFEFFDRFS
jgi:Flp pilus assembly protein protease CpaA